MISFTTLMWLLIELAVILIGLAFFAAALDVPEQERKNKGGQRGGERKR